MNVRERIEAIAQRLDQCAEDGEFRGDDHRVHLFLEDAAFLRAILADLPTESVQTRCAVGLGAKEIDDVPKDLLVECRVCGTEFTSEALALADEEDFEREGLQGWYCLCPNCGVKTPPPAQAAETPPTLAEFRASGEWFLCRPIGAEEIRVLAFQETETEEGECYLALIDQDGNVWEVDIRDGFEIKRLCDSQWYPVEGE